MSQRGRFLLTSSVRNGSQLEPSLLTMICKLEGGKSQVQVVSWYDNENSYVSQMVRTIKYFSELK